MDFLTLRREIIKKYFSRMNERQFEAVTTVDGPVLVLAGAGSGKTTVLVNRILNLIKFGNAYQSDFVPFHDETDIAEGLAYINGESETFPETVFSVSPAKPWQILAITFTNKAANELKERIAQKIGPDSQDIWAGTFHSLCGKILRRNADLLGFSSHFTIYDTDDQRRLMKEIMKQHNVDEKFVSHKVVLAAISSAKDSLISPEEFALTAGHDFRQKNIAQLYSLYQEALKRADAMDFDDMIYKTVELLKNNPEVLEYYFKKFRYCLVDEYQDTNHAQYVLISLLSSGENNICVVGDDDQSIYRFRGATIENILSFETKYSNAKIIRLEQNYRSTETILKAANEVIANNDGRKGKTLWTDNGKGDKIKVHTAADEREEARFVADSILENVRRGVKFCDHAVFYRMNAQSNAVENVFMRSGIPYTVVGSTKFFDRKEIKDVLAYLHLINNNNDDLRLRRIINTPKRAIGETTVNRAGEIASQLNISIFEVIKRADEYAALSKSAAKLKTFCGMIEELTALSEGLSLSELFEEMLDKSGYSLSLANEGIEGAERLENVKEFASTILQYEEETDEPSLSDFLEQISLVSDIDSLDNSADRVVLMTVHSSKGLEFDNVYLVGLEEGIFPGNLSIAGGKSEIEEERRLAYVAITRARKKLTVTNAFSRVIFGSTNRNFPSRFLKEIPEELCEISGRSVKPSSSFSSSVTTIYGGYSPRKEFNDYTKNSYTQPQVKNDISVYAPGIKVLHKAFGTGTILSVTPTGNDALLEIEFENIGLKKVMAGFAKLTILQ